jgi:hypothetical protein
VTYYSQQAPVPAELRDVQERVAEQARRVRIIQEFYEDAGWWRRRRLAAQLDEAIATWSKLVRIQEILVRTYKWRQ